MPLSSRPSSLWRMVTGAVTPAKRFLARGASMRMGVCAFSSQSFLSLVILLVSLHTHAIACCVALPMPLIEKDASSHSHDDIHINPDIITDSDANARYLHSHKDHDHPKNSGLTSRTALLVCALLCFIVFFYCLLSIVCSIRREDRQRLGWINGLNNPDNDNEGDGGGGGLRGAIVKNLSLFQRRAIWELFFADVDKDEKKMKQKGSSGKKHTDKCKSRNGSAKGEDACDCQENDGKSDSDDCDHQESPLIPEATATIVAMSPLRRKKKDSDEECPPTPPTRRLSPDGYYDIATKCDGASINTDGNRTFGHLDAATIMNIDIPKLDHRRNAGAAASKPTAARNDSPGGVPGIIPRLKFPISASARAEDIDLHIDVDTTRTVAAANNGSDDDMQHLEDRPPLNLDSMTVDNSPVMGRCMNGVAAHASVHNNGNDETVALKDAEKGGVGQEDEGDVCSLASDKSDGKKFSEMKYTSDDEEEEINEEEESVMENNEGMLVDENVCSICLDSYDDEGKSRVKSKHCVHYFHKECIIQWLERETSDHKCPCCRNRMITVDELRDAATQVVGEKKIGKVIKDYESPPLSPSLSLNPFASPRRRTYSEESPVFVPDFNA